MDGVSVVDQANHSQKGDGSEESGSRAIVNDSIKENIDSGKEESGSRKFASDFRKDGHSVLPSANEPPFDAPIDIAIRQFVFLPPDEGTPAAAALLANANIKVSKIDKGLHKLRTMKRPKMKALNFVKQMKKHTKNSKSKHFSTNFKGKVIDGRHELYILTAGMMLGIRCSVGRASSLRDNTTLSSAAFNTVENIRFPPGGNNAPPFFTPPHSLTHTFKFKTYAPKVFKHIRHIFNIDTASYMLSVCGNYNFLEFISNSKSGQFFFYSHDGKYMIKTQTKEENKFMKKILPAYYNHVATNPHTLLVHILGMHRVKMYHLRRKVHFVIMTSVFDTPQKIHTIYDLKGSTIGREATEKEREKGGVLKDMDLLRSKRKIHFGSKKEMIVRQLEIDSTFLSSLNIMDYSLLVGIHDRTLRVDELDNSNHDNTNLAVSHSNTPFRRMSQSSNVTGCPSSSRRGSVAADQPNDLEVIDDWNVEINNIELSLGDDGDDGEDENNYDGLMDGNDDTFNDDDSSDVEDDDGDSVWESDDDRRVRVTIPGKHSVDNVKHESTVDKNKASTWSWLGDLFTCTSNNAVVINANAPSELVVSNANGGAATVADTIKHTQSFDPCFSNHPWTTRKDFGINSEIEGERGDEIYYFGIIDILQQYNFRKRGENLIKGFSYDTTQISAVHPNLYASRFSKFIVENSD